LLPAFGINECDNRTNGSGAPLRMRRFHPGTGITVSPGLSSGSLHNPPPPLPAPSEAGVVLVSGHEEMISLSADSWL